MALESVLKSLGQEGTLRRILQAVTYSRTSTDAMRTNVDGGSIVVQGIQWGMYNGYAAFYAQGGPNSVDTREPLRLQHRLLMTERTKKWTYT